MLGRIHVIEPDVCRRAHIVRVFNDLNVYAEIYRDLTSFKRANPTEGCLLASDHGEIAGAIQTSGSRLPFIMYSDAPSTEMVVTAMRAGALDYLQWPFVPQLLRSAIQQLDAGDKRLMHEDQLRAGAVALVDRLTCREKDVLLSLVQGMSNKEIGRALGISPRTVEIHRCHMMMKLGAHSPADAVRVALYSGLDRDFRFAA
jgi:two-component system, LuxR family, response regulator FixJ